MAVKYGKFEMPKKIKIEEIGPHKIRCIAEPFERGYGHTVGNLIRRIILTSLEAPAILSVRIEGVSHEYTAIEGIIEDMTVICLNLKEALLRMKNIEDETLMEPRIITKTLEITTDQIAKNKGAYQVTLGDILGESPFELVNPDFPVFTVTKPLIKQIDLRIGIGRGYVPSERHNFEPKMHEIVLDSIFSPVRLVNYFVENTRVGQDTDFDRLILEITTDGRITPKEALNFSIEIGKAHLQVFDSLKKHEVVFDTGEVTANKEKEEILEKLALKINEIELSVRSTNCLAGANITTIGELVVMPESEMLRFRNFGKKSLSEIKEKLAEMGLSLGMDLSKYGINRGNIQAIIEKYLQEKVEK
ncbi:MAG: DNA-directed RNA polymerase subunit alpha [Parachlamydiales bacterium]|nr:DNA-directed RNA polymerase subunit alpha [Parachlamydiales bacterium]